MHLSLPLPNTTVSSALLLKNVIDWVSRPDSDEPDLEPYKGKVAALLAASPGGLGGLRGLPALRQLLSGIGVLVVPQQLAVGGAGSVFDGNGGLADESWKPKIAAVVSSLIETSTALKQ
jgi:chromate reductase